MSRMTLQKPDKFYFVFAAIMLVMAGFVVFSFKMIFDSINESADIGAQFTASELKIDKDQLDQAVKIATDKKMVELNMVASTSATPQ